MNKQSQVRPHKPAGPAKMTAAILVAGAAVGLAACSSGTSTSSSSHTAAPRTTSAAASPSASPHSGSATVSPAACKHVNSLRGSLETLTHLQLNASSAGQIRTNLTNIQTQLTNLKGEASGQLSHQVSQLSNSVDQVNKAAKNLSTPPSASQITAVVSALSGLRTQSKTAIAQMSAACPKG